MFAHIHAWLLLADPHKPVSIMALSKIGAGLAYGIAVVVGVHDMHGAAWTCSLFNVGFRFVQRETWSLAGFGGFLPVKADLSEFTFAFFGL